MEARNLGGEILVRSAQVSLTAGERMGLKMRLFVFVLSIFGGCLAGHAQPGAAQSWKSGVALDWGKLSDEAVDRKSTRLNSSHIQKSRMPSSA